MMTKRPKTQEGEAEPSDVFLGQVGHKVKEARARADLTLADLGERAGLASSYVYAMEQHGSNLTLKTLKKVADALEVAPRDLMPESELDSVSASGLARLIAALDHATSVIENRASEDRVIVEQLRSFTLLKAGLERLAAGSDET